jgi:hypothetical protein
MEADRKSQRDTLDNAWLAALARAAGNDELAERYGDRMMRAWALLRDADVIFDDDDQLHGASGDW